MYNREWGRPRIMQFNLIFTLYFSITKNLHLYVKWSIYASTNLWTLNAFVWLILHSHSHSYAYNARARTNTHTERTQKCTFIYKYKYEARTNWIHVPKRVGLGTNWDQISCCKCFWSTVCFVYVDVCLWAVVCAFVCYMIMI